MMLFTSLADCSKRRLEQVESVLFDKFQPLFSLRVSGNTVKLSRFRLIPLSFDLSHVHV